MTLDSRATSRLAAILFTVLLIQIAVIPHFRVAGYVIDLPLIAVLLISLRLSAPNGALTGFLVGIAIDLVIHTPFGMTALTFSLAGYAAGTISSQIVERNMATRALATALLAATTTTIFACIGALIGLEYVTRRELGAIALVTAGASLPITAFSDPLLRGPSPCRQYRSMNEQLNRRLAFLGILIIGLFAALFTRAWYLQVLTADELSEKARANYVEIVIAEPTRGRILDRHGVVLADNIRSGVITVNQSRYAPGQIDFVLEQISTLTEIPIETLKSRLENQQTHPLAAKIVATGLDEYGLLRVSELSLPGVEAKWEMSRIYPKRIGAHVVGYVGAMSRGQEDRLLQWDIYHRNESANPALNKSSKGIFTANQAEPNEVDSTGRASDPQQTDPTPGSDIYLSIDADLQQQQSLSTSRTHSSPKNSERR